MMMMMLFIEHKEIKTRQVGWKRCGRGLGCRIGQWTLVEVVEVDAVGRDGDG